MRQLSTLRLKAQLLKHRQPPLGGRRLCAERLCRQRVAHAQPGRVKEDPIAGRGARRRSPDRLRHAARRRGRSRHVARRALAWSRAIGSLGGSLGELGGRSLLPAARLCKFGLQRVEEDGAADRLQVAPDLANIELR